MKLFIANWADQNTLDDAHGWGLEDFATPSYEKISLTAIDAVEAAKASAMESAKVSFDEDDVTFEWRPAGSVTTELWVIGDVNKSEAYRYGLVVVEEVEIIA